MARLRSALIRPPILGIFFLLIVFGIYLILVRPVEQARDIAIQDHYAFLAAGPAGLRIVDISNPDYLREISHYDTLGTANSVFIDGDKAYIADGENGLLILDIKNKTSIHLLGAYQSPGSALDVAVKGDYAYLVDSRIGLRVLRIDNPSNPAHPSGSQDFKARSRLAKIHISGDKAYLADLRGNLYLLDISDRGSPKQIGEFNARSRIYNITTTGEIALLAAGKRGLIALNLEDSGNIEQTGQLETAGSAQGVAVAGSYAYVADGENGLVVVDITKRDALAKVGEFHQPKDAIDLLVTGNHVFIADGVDGIRAVDARVQLRSDLLSPENQPGNTEDVAVKGNYAFLASESQGVRVLDISNPANPREVDQFDTTGSATGVLVYGDYIFAADGNDGLKILYDADAAPERVKLELKSQLDTPGEARDLATDGKLAYLADGPRGLQVIDLENPEQPRIIGAEESINHANNVAISNVAISKEYVFVADGESGLQVVNVLDPTRPAVVATLDTPGEARGVAVMESGGRRYVLVADGGAGLRVVDVSDPRNPQEAGFNDLPPFADDIFVNENIAYVASREGGVLAYDITDPTNPRAIDSFDTPGLAQGLAFSENRLFIADYDRGMQILNVSNPSDLAVIGFYDVPKTVREVVMRDFAYVVDGQRGLRVIDVGNPGNLSEIGFYDSPGRAKGLAVGDGFAYLGVENALYVLDISDPRNPKKVGEAGIARKITGVAVKGDYVYVASEGGLRIFNVEDPTAPVEVGRASISAGALDIALWDEYAFIPAGPGGLQILNVGDPANPVSIGPVLEMNDARAVVVQGGYAYVANGVNGLGVVDVTKPAAPEPLTQVPLPGVALDIGAASDGLEDYLFLACDGGGIQYVNVLNPANPLPVGSFTPPGGNLALDVQTVPSSEREPAHFSIFVAGDSQGLQIVDARPFSDPVQVGLYNSPGILSFGRVLRETPGAILALLRGDAEAFQPKYWRTLVVLLFDLLIFVFASILFLAFVAQFVLPVEGISQRLEVIRRFVDFLLGRIGPGVYVQEGEPYAGPILIPGGSGSPAPGTFPNAVMVDARSAGVLERRRRRYPLLLQLVISSAYRLSNRLLGIQMPGPPAPPDLQVICPGLTFTNYRNFPSNHKHAERLRGEADLRPQLRIRPEVRGYTRDGIELSTNIWVTFTLGELPDVLDVTYIDGKSSPENLHVITLENDPDQPGVKRIKKLSDELDPQDREEMHEYIHACLQSRKNNGTSIDLCRNPPYRFIKQNVFKAVASRAQDVQDDTYMEWDVLPPHVATEVFRNMLQTEVYDELYRPGDPVGFRITDFRDIFRHRVRNLGVLAYRYVECKDGKLLNENQEWNESELFFCPPINLQRHAVLRSRGIKVTASGFSGLEPVSPMVEDTFVKYWKARWENEENYIYSFHQVRAKQVQDRARVQAQRELAVLLKDAFQIASESREALVIHLFQTLEDAATEPATRQMLPGDLIAMLRTLRSWLLPGEESLPPWEFPPSGPGGVPPAVPPTSETTE